MSLDGGDLRGMIPALAVQYMEQKSYEYALSRGYIEPNDKKKISMSSMFDMIVGTSTGGLLVAAMVAPDPNNSTQPIYYSDDVITIYE